MKKGGKHRRLGNKSPTLTDDATRESYDNEPRQAEPKLTQRRTNRKSTIMSGRTIGEQREHMETKNERAAARKKDKKKATRRVLFTILGFIILGGITIFTIHYFISSNEPEPVVEIAEPTITEYKPTIEIIDEDASAAAGKITSRMTTYIGQMERDLRDLGYKPTKAVVPTGSIREVDFYLNGYTGYIKTTIDRGSAVSAEDADRLIRYLASTGVNDFQYLDIRLSGRAYWK